MRAWRPINRWHYLAGPWSLLGFPIVSYWKCHGFLMHCVLLCCKRSFGWQKANWLIETYCKHLWCRVVITCVKVIPSFCQLYYLQICCSKNLTEYCPIRNSDFDNQLEWLSAPIVDSKSNSTSVTVASAACKDHIVAVRYAWREAPCSVKNCAIYGADVNPMPPYIRYNLTDDGVTRPLGMDQVPIL